MVPKTIPPHLYRLLFENNMDAVFLTLPDGAIVAANDAACDLFGMTEAELCACGRDGLIDRGDPRVEEFIKERARTGKARAELIHRRKDGTTFVGEVRSVIVEEGNSSFAIVRDITRQKEAELALRRSEERFRTLTENNPDVIGRFDRQHRVLYFSPSVEQVTQIPAEDFLGKTGREMGMPQHLCTRWEESQDRAFRGERVTMQYQMTDLCGRERYVWDMFLPEFGPDGSVESVLSLSRDITDLVEAQQLLQESNERLRLAQEAAGFGIWEWDVERNETTASRECYVMWGLDPQPGPSGRQWTEQIHPDDVECMLRELELFIERGGNWQKEFRIVRPDGDIRWLLSFGQPSRMKGGRVIGVVGCVLDITARKQAEQDLRQAQKDATFFAEALQSSSQPFAAGHPDGRLITFNTAFAALTGYTADELQRVNWAVDLTPGEWRDEESRVLEELHRTGQPQMHRMEYLRKDGTRVPVELKVHLGEDLGGKQYYFSFINDITERNRAEEALRKSEARYRGLFQNSLIGTMVADTSGCVVDGNDAFLQLIGRSREDLPLHRSEFSDPACHAADAASLVELMQTGVARPYEKQYLRPDGDRVPILAGASLLREEEGILVGFALDLTQEKRVQEELARRAAELEAVLDAMQGAVVVFDREGTPIRTNPAADKVFAFEIGVSGSVKTVAEVLKMRHLDGREMAMHELPCSKALSGEQVTGMLYRYTSADGVERVGQASAGPLRVDGKIVGAVAVAEDVTERVRAEEALREEHRRKDHFLAMLSHELRNPLAPIRNSIYMLRHGNPDEEGALRAQEVIERQADQLTRLVDDLLDVTRISRGKIRLDRSRVDLRDVVRGVVEDFRNIMERRGISVTAEVPDREVAVLADRARVVQVLGNLLHNAAKFTSHGGSVTVRLGCCAGVAEVSVADTGRGIDPALAGSIFDIFVQGEANLARTEGGLGLGLALVKGITEMHGGTVRVTSPGAGKGAEFVVSLPIAQEPAAKRPLQTVSTPQQRKQRVLVVDDNSDAADSLASIVRLYGYEVAVVYDGPGAVAAVQRLSPHIVLCDVGLPGMSGYEVARTIRNDKGNGIVLVAITGYARPEDVLDALHAGFDRHLAKPVHMDNLVVILEEMGSR